MATPYIGEVRMFGGNFVPRGYALCDGQVLPAAQFAALFSILGGAYGGDGTTTFALPNLGGRAARGVGQGPGLSTVRRGDAAGEYAHTLTVEEYPAHSHRIRATSETAAAAQPQGNLFAAQSGINGQVYGTPENLVTMAPHTIQPTGVGVPHDNLQPYLVITYIIAVEGIFPARN